jgi:Ala-tRNA(Pro) deacylase
MDCRARLESLFRERGVSFEVQEHPTAFTAQTVAASEHVPGRMFAKVVMVLADGELVMLVLPAPSMVDVSKLGAVFGGRQIRLASEEDFAAAFPDCEPGAMPPFGNEYGVPVYADRTLGNTERVVFQAGSHNLSMSVAYADFERVAEPTVADIAVLR